MTSKIPDTSPANPMPMQGEGDYAGARKFDAEQAAFAKSGGDYPGLDERSYPCHCLPIEAETAPCASTK